MTGITWGALLLCLASPAMVVSEVGPPDDRPGLEAQREAARRRSRLEAYASHRARALDPREDPARAGESLKAAVACLAALARGGEVDALRDATLAAHKDQWRVLLAAAQTLAGGAHSGQIIGETFFRERDFEHRGRPVGCVERDRVRALRLAARAIELAGEGAGTAGLAELHLATARILLMEDARGSVEQGWKLQRLTDLGELPDYVDLGDDSDPDSAQVGAPVDRDGQPVFFRVPATLEAARNDGERWRWHLARCIELDPTRRSEARTALADFLRGQLDVATVATQGEPAQVDDDRDGALGPYAVASLREDETVARLATGVRRITLPDEFNYIKMYRSIADDDPGPWGRRALDALGVVFEDRRQYPRAAEVWERAIARYGRGEDDVRGKHLAQIVGNWGEFEPARVQPAGRAATVGFRFRNARTVRFEAREVLVAKLIDDARGYLESLRAGMVFDRDRIELAEIGPRLIAPGGERYVGPLVASWDLELEPKAGHLDRRIEVATPLNKAGTYLLSARLADGTPSRIVVSLADTVIVKKPSKTGQFFYVADAATGRPVPHAALEFLGYRPQWQAPGWTLTRMETRAFARTTGPDGQLIVDDKALDGEFQWLTVARTAAGGRAFVGFGDRGYPYHRDLDGQRLRTFLITDRPIYRPGQPVRFKGWARRTIDGKPAGPPAAALRVRVKINNPASETVFEHEYATDELGGFDGEYAPPKAAALGSYTLSIDPDKEEDQRDSVRFRVESYRPPDFFVGIDMPAAPVRLGEPLTATVRASYYSGTPVRQAKVSYQVKRLRHLHAELPEGRWDWLYGSGYGFFARHQAWPPRHLFEDPAVLRLAALGWSGPERAWLVRLAGGEEDQDSGVPLSGWDGLQDERGEEVQRGEVPIGPDGTVRLTIATARGTGEFAEGDYRYVVTAQVVDGSRRMIEGTGSALALSRPFEAFAWLDRGYYRPGQEIVARLQARAIGDRPVAAKGKATLFQVTYPDGKPVERAVATHDLATDGAGLCTLRLEAGGPGRYRLALALTEEGGTGRSVERACVFLVADDRFDGAALRFDGLELIADRREYSPGDRVRLLVNADHPDATVLLFVRAARGKVGPARVLQLAGKSTAVEIELVKSDVPNVFIEGLTIADGRIFHDTAEVLIPPEKTALHVNVTPSRATDRPGAPAKVAVKLTDEAGEPFVGALALAVYDKALDALAEGSNVPPIRPFFWGARREHDAGHDSSLGTRFESLFVEGQEQMQTIGVFGDRSVWGEPVQYGFMARTIRSVSMASADLAAPVGGLAGGAREFDLGRAGPAEVVPRVRTAFEGTALWAPALTTDREGVAEIGLTLPENLTTWKIRAWALGAGTQVGEGEAEIVTAKDLLVRLQAPRFLVEGDEVVLSASIHNDRPTEQSLRAVLELDGRVLELRDEPSRAVRIASGGERRVDWKVRAARAGEAVVRVKALGAEESDATEARFPAVVHGQLKTDAFVGSIGRDRSSARLVIRIPEARRPADTRVEVRYSPTLAASLVDALPFLAGYPYGCTEQTLNRFLPTVITQGVLRRSGLDLKTIHARRKTLDTRAAGGPTARRLPPHNAVFDEGEVRAMAEEGLAALAAMQHPDGAWGWFSGDGERSDPHLTALVVHGLLTGRANGLTFPPSLLERGTGWLEAYQAEQVTLLANAATQTRPYRDGADNLDALVLMVLAEVRGANADADSRMIAFLDRDRGGLSVYGLTLLGLALEKTGPKDVLGRILHAIEGYLVNDPENQTAHLRLPPDDRRWHWSTCAIETQASYLMLLARTDPKGTTAPALVRYLLNNRRHASYWDSTRDTALCIESMAEYLKASGEDRPAMVVHISIDGQPRQETRIGPDNLFQVDNTLVLAGDEIGPGEHTIEITRKGDGPVYFDANVRYFTLEDPIRRSGLEVKVDRKLYKIRADVTTRPGAREVREPLAEGQVLRSGDLVEVELIVESKNDYEYLLIEDHKPAGFEPVALQSGYDGNALGAYVELRDQTVGFFTRFLSRGVHSVRYRVRAEAPGRFSALPAVAFGMYSPELQGNSDEAKVVIED